MSDVRMARPATVALAALLASCDRADRPEPPAGATVTPPPREAPLALLSPRLGDTLVEGRSYVIRWSAPAGMRINLGAVMGGKDRGMLLTDAPAQPDSLVWTVPSGFVTGFGIRSSDQVRLRLERADSAERWVEAGPFTVTGAR
jgi:hypothetical protein